MGQPRYRDLDDEQPTFRGARPRSTGWVLSVLLFAVAGALMYYGSQLWLQHDSTQAALDRANAALAEVQGKSNVRGGKLAALEKQHVESSAQLVQANAKVLELNTALAAAQTRLDQLD